jgi:hypothetical protein
MFVPAFLRRALYILAAFVLCTLSMPRNAAADQIYSVSVTGTGSCAAGACTGSTITGTYLWDITTDSPASSGTWSFDTPIGDFSGAGGASAEPSSDVIGDQSGFNLLDFITTGDTAGIQLGFSGNSSFDGSLVALDGFGNVLSVAATLPDVSNNVFDITSGTAVGTLVTTPEPSAAPLLGLGLLALFIIRRKRSASEARPVQS